MSMSATINRHAIGIGILLTCTATFLYVGLYTNGTWNSVEVGARIYPSSQTNFNTQGRSYHPKFTVRNSTPSNPTFKEDFRKPSNGEREAWDTTKPQRKPTSPFQYVTKLPFTHSTEPIRRSEVKNEWSKSWPQVNIGSKFETKIVV